MKMFQSLFLTAFLLGSGCTVSMAQSAHFGIKGGFSAVDLTDDNGSKLSGFGGIFVNVPLGYHWYIQPEVLYAGGGGVYGNSYFFNPNSPYNTTVSMGWVQVPVVFQYRFRVVYLEFGPQLGLLTSATDITNGVRTDAKSNFNNTDFDLDFGIGFDLGPVFSIYSRYNLGLTQLYNNAQVPGSEAVTTYNRGIQFGVAFKFPNRRSGGRY